MNGHLHSCAVAGVAVVGAGLIGLTTAVSADIQSAASHSSAEVALTSAADWFGGDFGGLISGDQDLASMIDSIAPYVEQFTVEIVDTFDWLNDSSGTIDSVLGWLGVSGAGDWIGTEYDLVQSALVAEGFDPSAFDSSELSGSELTFDLNLGWASWLLGLSGDHSAELNELLGLGSQLATSTLNVLVVSLGTISPILGDIGSETDLNEAMAVLQPLYEDYMTQRDTILESLLPILQDLGYLELGDVV